MEGHVVYDGIMIITKEIIITTSEIISRNIVQESQHEGKETRYISWGINRSNIAYACQ